MGPSLSLLPPSCYLYRTLYFWCFIWGRAHTCIQPVEETGFVTKVQGRNFICLCSSLFPPDTYRRLPVGMRNESDALHQHFSFPLLCTTYPSDRPFEDAIGFLFFFHSPSLVLVSLLLYLYVAIPPSPFPRFVQILPSNAFYNPLPITPFRVYPSLQLVSFTPNFPFFINHIATISNPITKKVEAETEHQVRKAFFRLSNPPNYASYPNHPIQLYLFFSSSLLPFSLSTLAAVLVLYIKGWM